MTWNFLYVTAQMVPVSRSGIIGQFTLINAPAHVFELAELFSKTHIHPNRLFLPSGDPSEFMIGISTNPLRIQLCQLITALFDEGQA
jgi:hypothetical protein